MQKTECSRYFVISKANTKLPQFHIGMISWILQLQATEEVKRAHLFNTWQGILSKYMYTGRI